MLFIVVEAAGANIENGIQRENNAFIGQLAHFLYSTERDAFVYEARKFKVWKARWHTVNPDGSVTTWANIDSNRLQWIIQKRVRLLDPMKCIKRVSRILRKEEVEILENSVLTELQAWLKPINSSLDFG